MIFLLISKQKMIDFSRTFCDLHPNELISNFCCKEQCNIGLCATCICSHTQSHIQKRTAPEYENIRSTYSKMQENIRARISGFQQQKSRINLIIEAIQNKRKQVSEVIQQARSETVEFVNKFYDAKEKELLRRVEADEKKVGLHNENRMESLINLISRDVNTLFASAQDLNSQTFLESFHRIRTQVLGNSLQTEREISAELEKNENYQTTSSINALYISDIKNALQRSIVLVFGQKRSQRVSQMKEINKNSRISMVNNENSNISVTPKRAQSLTRSNMVQPRFSSMTMEPFNQFLAKEPTQPHLHHVVRRSDIYMPNNSLQVPIHPNQQQSQQNYGSRIQFRPNSSEKTIKENIPVRYQLVQNNTSQSTFTPPNTNFEESKKLKKSGLTLLKPSDNIQKFRHE